MHCISDYFHFLIFLNLCAGYIYIYVYIYIYFFLVDDFVVSPPIGTCNFLLYIRQFVATQHDASTMPTKDDLPIDPLLTNRPAGLVSFGILGVDFPMAGLRSLKG